MKRTFASLLLVVVAVLCSQAQVTRQYWNGDAENMTWDATGVNWLGWTADDVLWDADAGASNMAVITNGISEVTNSVTIMIDGAVKAAGVEITSFGTVIAGDGSLTLTTGTNNVLSGQWAALRVPMTAQSLVKDGYGILELGSAAHEIDDLYIRQGHVRLEAAFPTGGLYAQLDASDRSSIRTNSAGEMTQWYRTVVGGAMESWRMFVPWGTKGPVWSSDALGGRGGFIFGNGVGNRIWMGDGLNIEQQTVFIASRPTSTSQNSSSALYTGKAWNDPRIYQSGKEWMGTNSSGAFHYKGWMRVNGVDASGNVSVGTDINILTSVSVAQKVLNITMGTKADSTSYYWQGELGEVIIYSRQLTENEMLAVENYLMKKWMGEKVSEEPFFVNPISLRMGDTTLDLTGRDLCVSSLTNTTSGTANNCIIINTMPWNTTFTVDVAEGQSSRFSGRFLRDITLCKKGVGVFNLLGSGNDYHGRTVVEEGMLAIGSAGKLSSVAGRETSVEIAADAVLDLGGTVQTIVMLRGSGTVRNGTLNVQQPIAYQDGLTLGNGAPSQTVELVSGQTAIYTGDTALEGITFVLKGDWRITGHVLATTSGTFSGVPTVTGVSLNQWNVRVTPKSVMLLPVAVQLQLY